MDQKFRLGTNYGCLEVLSWQMSWSEGSEMASHTWQGSWVDMAARLGSAGTVDQRTVSSEQGRSYMVFDDLD